MNGQLSCLGDPSKRADVGQCSSAPVVYLFPGLGNQYVNMGLGLYRRDEVFRAQLDECASILQPLLGLDIRHTLYPDGTANTQSSGGPTGKLDFRRMLGRSAGPPSEAQARLNQTRLVQPVLFSVEYALARTMATRAAEPAALIGYSLGEYVAACIARVMSLQDSLKLVVERANLIDQLAPGAMVALSLPEARVKELIGPELSISAVNAPEVCVVAGPVAAIESLERRLAERELAFQRIPTTHAFHSSMMRAIVPDLMNCLARVQLHPPRIPYISNVTGTWITELQAVDPDYWAQHLCNAVRFHDGLSAVFQNPGKSLVELGPGQALGSLAMQHESFSNSKRNIVVSAMRYEYDSQEDVEVLARAVERLRGGKPIQDPTATTTHCNTSNDAALKLRDIWLELLKIDTVSDDTHFFYAGGNSLLATRLAFRVRKVFKIDISLRKVFAAATFQEMLSVICGADAVANSADNTKEQTAVPHREVLPNGLSIGTHSPSEVKHFYQDIFEHKSYLRYGVHVPERACVFDVGANIGMFSLFIGKNWADAKIFAFEPAPPLFALLRSNLENNGIAAELFNCGVSDRPGTATFTFYPASSGMSSFYPNLDEEKQALRLILENQLRQGVDGMSEIMTFSEELLDQRFRSQQYECALRTLSSVIRERQVERIDLLKIDVQKAEFDVLLGIDAQDWSKIRQVVAEVHDIDGRLVALTKHLQYHGFKSTVHQDELYRGSNIFNVYSTRE